MTEWILSSSIVILMVIGLRTCFKGKISLRLQYAIWGLVLLRLIVPFSIGSTSFSVANFAAYTEVYDVVIHTAEPGAGLKVMRSHSFPRSRPTKRRSSILLPMCLFLMRRPAGLMFIG